MIYSNTECHSMSHGFSWQKWSRTPLSIAPRNVQRARLPAFDKIRNIISLAYDKLGSLSLSIKLYFYSIIYNERDASKLFYM